MTIGPEPITSTLRMSARFGIELSVYIADSIMLSRFAWPLIVVCVLARAAFAQDEAPATTSEHAPSKTKKLPALTPQEIAAESLRIQHLPPEQQAEAVKAMQQRLAQSELPPPLKSDLPHDLNQLAARRDAELL